MDVNIDFAPGAEHNELATWMKELLEVRLRAEPARCARLRTMRAAVFFVSQDRRQTITLRFDHGPLTIHDGKAGVPDITFCGDHAVLVGLSELRWAGSTEQRLRSWGRTLSELLSKQRQRLTL